MNILITGASGFVGRNVLLHKPSSWKVTAVYNRSADFTRFLSANNIQGTTPVQCDLTDEQAVREAFGNRQFDACLFLAAHVDPNASLSNPAYDLQLNTLTLLNVLQSGVRIKRFVYLSSGSVYEGAQEEVHEHTAVQPKVPYSIAKYASEQYVKSFAARGNPQEYVIVRFFGCYGPYEPERKLYRKLMRQFAIEGNPDVDLYGDGTNSIYAMYVDDAVAGLVSVTEGKASDVTVDFCGEKMTIREVVERAAKHFGIQPNIRYNNAPPAEAHNFFVTNNAMIRHFGFRPTISFEAALDKYKEWLLRE